MNRRGFMKFLGALGLAPKVAPDLQAFDLPRCPRCKDSKLVCVVTHPESDYFGPSVCYTSLDCPDCEPAKFKESIMLDFTPYQRAEVRFQLDLIKRK